MSTLSTFGTRLDRLVEENDLVCRAKEALNLENSRDERLVPVAEELRDLQAVWTALSGIWGRLSQVRETLWSVVQVRHLDCRFETDLMMLSSPGSCGRSSTLYYPRHETCLAECGSTLPSSTYRRLYDPC